MSLLMDALNKRQGENDKSTESGAKGPYPSGKGKSSLFIPIASIMAVGVSVLIVALILQPGKSKKVAEVAQVPTTIALSDIELPDELPSEPTHAVKTPEATEPVKEVVHSKKIEDAMLEGVLSATVKALGKENEAQAVDEAPADYTLKASAEMLDHLEKTAAVALVEEVDTAQKAVDELEVTGVMFSESESKVLLNGSLYGIGGVVNQAESIQLVNITPHILEFADGRGRRYEKSY